MCTRSHLDCHQSLDAPTASSFTRPWPVRMIAAHSLCVKTAFVKLLTVPWEFSTDSSSFPPDSRPLTVGGLYLPARAPPRVGVSLLLWASLRASPPARRPGSAPTTAPHGRSGGGVLRRPRHALAATTMDARLRPLSNVSGVIVVGRARRRQGVPKVKIFIKNFLRYRS